jgi:hypothetical protein
MSKRLSHLALVVTLSSAVLLGVAAVSAAPTWAAVNAAPPSQPVKLVFIHHSTGEDWLADGHGGLGVALRDNGYFVSDTNYGWGPDAIGDSTDIGHWWTWFRSPDAPRYTTALYAESGQSCSYSRLAADPGGPSRIVLFKSCFPNSNLLGDPMAPVPGIAENALKGQACGGEDFTVANAKGIYNDLLPYFAAHQEKLFVLVVSPPIQSPAVPANGRAMADWLVDHWLQDAGYSHRNVAVFDFYTVLTSNGGDASTSDLNAVGGNHHRVWNGEIQHTTTGGTNHLMYPSGGDDHPNAAGDHKATAELVPLLNAAYNAWQENPGGDTQGPVTSAPRRATVRRHGLAKLYYRVDDDQSASATVTIRITRRGHKVKSIAVGLRGTGAQRVCRYRCHLAKGTYRFTVLARDLSGNAQTVAASNVLRVK